MPAAGSGGGALPPRSGLVVDADPSVPVNALAHALCAKIFECDRATLGALTQEECAIYFSQPCIFIANITAADGLDACIAAVGSLRCNAEGELDLSDNTACSDAYARARARAAGLPLQTIEGAPCGDGTECTGDLLCSNFSSGCGTCERIAHPGEPCPENGFCWSGYCDPATNRCTESKADGEACTTPDECDSLNCSAAGICKPETGEDFVCTSDLDCGSDRCIEGECVDGVPPGGACASTADCEDGFCEDGICKLSARCTLGEVGDPCGFIDCAGNLECVDNVCIAVGTVGMPDGSPCSVSSQCASGYCGNSLFGDVDDVCAKRPAGRPCDANDQCSSGLCASFRCAGSGMCVQ